VRLVGIQCVSTSWGPVSWELFERCKGSKHKRGRTVAEQKQRFGRAATAQPVQSCAILELDGIGRQAGRLDKVRVHLLGSAGEAASRQRVVSRGAYDSESSDKHYGSNGDALHGRTDQRQGQVSQIICRPGLPRPGHDGRSQNTGSCAKPVSGERTARDAATWKTVVEPDLNTPRPRPR
jgi:hypothetical protein